MSAGIVSDVFLSYHWRDHSRVEAIARWLRDQGLRVFLDRWYLTVGQPWPEALEQTLGSCRAVAIFVGPGEMGPWQQREKYLALERQGREAGFPVIPVLLPQADEEDAPFFFGRESAADRLQEAVARKSLIAVVGASGSGKSSVVRAGLLPRLRCGGDRVWEIATLVPGDRPLHALSAALVPLLEPDMTETDRLIEIRKQARALRRGDLKLRDIVARVLQKQPGTDRLLLVVDQWEALYTLATAEPEDERADAPGPEPGSGEATATTATPAELAQRVEAVRRRFIDELLEASRASSLSVVLTLRGDFVGQALGYRPNGLGVGGKDKWERSAPVGSFPPNGFGLYDMIGNAWEWTSSVYADYPYRSDDGREDPASRRSRAVRGGSWGLDSRFLRTSDRFDFSPATRFEFLGFRCARDVSP